MGGTDRNAAIWRLSLEQIDSIVSTQLGPGRVAGNEQGPCFSRQISMYLAKHVGGWSMVKIGRFYNGRHHTTVLHAIQKVQRLRSEDESIDALIELLIAALRENVGSGADQSLAGTWQSELIETITDRVLYRLAELRRVSVQPDRTIEANSIRTPNENKLRGPKHGGGAVSRLRVASGLFGRLGLTMARSVNGACEESEGSHDVKMS